MHNFPDARELLLIGGGHAHVAVLRSFGMRPLPGLRITLVSRELDTPYSGMLPGLIAGHYTFDETHIDLGPLARFAGARLVHGEVAALDTALREVTLQGGRRLRYDLVSINSGIVPTMRGVEGDTARVLQVKPISRFLPQWQALVSEVDAEPEGPRRLVVVGGGAGGVELALSVAWRLRSVPGVSVQLVTADAQIVPSFNTRARRRLGIALLAAGVDVRTGLRVTSVGATWIAAGDVQLPADAVLWTTNAAAPAWLAAADVDTDQDGFLCVNAHLASTSHADVFGAGDAVTLTHAPRPRSGVFAVRAGRALSANLRLAALQRPLRRWRPQYRFLSIVSTGGRHAVASRGSWSAEGAWVWHWKDWIDRRFMRRFQELPAAMNDAPVGEGIALPDAADQPQMRCGGCGAKLGAQLLDRVLARLDLEHTAVGSGRVQLGVNARDDAAVISPGRAQLAVTVDGFRSFISDPYVFGRLAAVHALGDIYAMGAQPEGVLALATVPHAAEALMADDLYQMMAGGLSALTEAGTPLLGGHSAEGAELSLAFTALGRVVGEAAVTKAGMRAGDVLILTQALGTGVLFAAAGVGRARSRWLTAAIDEMQRLPASAAEICVAHGVGAMTDVTGFGLLGHVAEVSRASGRQVDLYLDRIPALDGALECLCAGLASSLQDNNRQVLGDFELVGVAAGDPRVELLVDPQTCGGLLASVPDQQADACVAALQAAGYRSACVIGRARGHAARTGESGRIVGSVQPV